MKNSFLKLKNSLSVQTEQEKMFDCLRERMQSGVSLIITFFIMTIILSIIIAITTLLYQEIRMIRNIGNSVVAFYVADSGIEKVLYYDRKVIPVGATRGICSMFSYDVADNPNECPSWENDREDIDLIDSALYCDDVSLEYPIDDIHGCDPDVCNNCVVSFKTTFIDTNKNYTVIATVIPAEENDTDLTIDSLGTYKNLTRKVELYMTKAEAEDLFNVYYAYVDPWSTEVGSGIKVEIRAEASKGISTIKAYIKTSYDGVPIDEIDLIQLVGDIYEGIWESESSETGSYYVDIIITDTVGNTFTKKVY
jgi:hypothetical protein